MYLINKMNNSDYNFLKSGRSTLIDPQKLSGGELESINVLLSLFISNAMINSSNYVKYCGRNAVSTVDLVYGLRYEVFEFFSRPNLNNDIAQMTEDYRDMLGNKSDEDEIDIDDLVMPDDEVEEFNKIDSNIITEENKLFIEKFHHYYDIWDSWEPNTPLEIILKTAIDKINK